jgi:hypothetical protein
MTYDDIEYVIRASPGRHEWTLLIYFSDNVPGNAKVIQFSGSLHRRIDSWMRRQRRKAREAGQPDPQKKPAVKQGFKSGGIRGLSACSIAHRNESDECAEDKESWCARLSLPVLHQPPRMRMATHPEILIKICDEGLKRIP